MFGPTGTGLGMPPTGVMSAPLKTGVVVMVTRLVLAEPFTGVVTVNVSRICGEALAGPFVALLTTTLVPSSVVVSTVLIAL
jgi:hypothetical protein